GLADPMDELAKKPLVEHLTDYRGFLTNKGNTAAHVAMTCSRIKACLDASRFVKIADVQPSAVLAVLADPRKAGKAAAVPVGRDAFTVDEVAEMFGIERDSVNAHLRRWRMATMERDGVRMIERADVEQMAAVRAKGRGITTANAYLTALRGFTRWLWKDRRTATDPLAGMSRLAAEDDGECRRPLEPAEFLALLETARRSERSFRGLAGKDRLMIYAAAAGTGFRAAELASLRPESFALAADPPIATVEAAYAKNGETANQPLPPDLAEALRDYLAGKPAGERVWPGTWYTKAFEMIRADLADAGIPYFDADGQRRDFHSLRGAYITALVRTGANAKVVQELARHSTVQLTLGHYAFAAL